MFQNWYANSRCTFVSTRLYFNLKKVFSLLSLHTVNDPCLLKWLTMLTSDESRLLKKQQNFMAAGAFATLKCLSFHLAQK